MHDALTIAAERGKSDKAKPFKVVDGGIFEIALKHRGDAFRSLRLRGGVVHRYTFVTLPVHLRCGASWFPSQKLAFHPKKQ